MSYAMTDVPPCNVFNDAITLQKICGTMHESTELCVTLSITILVSDRVIVIESVQ